MHRLAIKEYHEKIQQIEERKRKDYERKLRIRKNFWYALSPFEFESKLGELFEDLGFEVKVTKKSNDGGIDIIINKEDKTIGIQCKRYKDKVGAQAVRELWGVKDYFKLNNKRIKIDGVIMVALSDVTKSAYEFIQNFEEYELWNIDTILTKADEVNYNYKKST